MPKQSIGAPYARLTRTARPKSPHPSRARRRSVFAFDIAALRPKYWTRIAISIVFIVTGVVGFFVAPPTFGLLAVVGALGLMWSAYDVGHVMFANSDAVIAASPDLYNVISKTTPDAAMKRLGGGIELLPHHSDAICWSAEINRWLRNADPLEVTISLNERAKRISRFRQDPDRYGRLLYAAYGQSRRQGRIFDNGSKVCLSSDLPPVSDVVTIWEGSYFISYLTNELTRLRFEPRGQQEPEPLSDPRTAFTTYAVDSEFQLFGLGASCLANHIGANTLGITDDGQLALWRQAASAQFSNGLLAPTGSGSLDWSDTVGAHDLQPIVIKGMQRECLEESTRRRARLNPGWIRQTKLIGYYRWVGRGGLPGFTGVSRLTVPGSQLSPNISEVDSPTDVQTLWDATSIKALLKSTQTLLTNHESRLSVPLIACLRALENVIAEDPDYLADLLR